MMIIGGLITLLFSSHCIHSAALSVTIGFEQSEYTIGEVDGYQLACLGVLSGDIDSREIVFDYSTTSGTASKTPALRSICR